MVENNYNYDYNTAVVEDVQSYLDDNYSEEELIEKLATDRDAFEQELNDTLWTEDSVTGNGSGSYTFNTYEAESNLCHNLDLLVEAIDNMGGTIDGAIRNGAESCDVTIRCYLLSQAISEVLDNFYDNHSDEIEAARESDEEDYEDWDDEYDLDEEDEEEV